MNLKTLDNSYINASPTIVVNVYPNGGSSISKPITITGGSTGILSANIQKNIRDDLGGKFSFILPPGGPDGVNSSLSWTNIITPLSLVVIGLQRGSSKRIVMVGLVTSVQETQEWQKSTVTRLVTVTGVDFAYYFNSFSYYTLSYLGFLASNTTLGLAGYIQIMNGKTLQGVACRQGQQWLSTVMIGEPNQAPTTFANIASVSAKPILSNTYIWIGNQKVYLNQLFGYWFEGFTNNQSTVFVPLMTDFLQSEGAWIEKFKVIFPWPYYEFFIITANQDDYPDNTGYPEIQTASITNDDTVGFGNIPLTQYQFSLPNFPSVFPIVVARVNPLPWAAIKANNTTVTSTTTSVLYSQSSYDNKRWNNLPTYQLSPYGFISSTVGYSINEVANFFMVTTTETYAAAQAANASSSLMFAPEIIGVYYSSNSINEYGFRSKTINTRWLSVLTSSLTADFFNNTNNYSQFLLGRLSSYFVPTPHMLNGTVTIPMWPDVMPGSRFVYSPFKNQGDYMFYIDGITHIYNFGGMCTTSLDLSRGLPNDDTGWTNEGLMTALHLDLVDRVNGVLQLRSSGNIVDFPGITFSNLSLSDYQSITNMMTSGKPDLSKATPTP
jgi:hypothetical protein